MVFFSYFWKNCIGWFFFFFFGFIVSLTTKKYPGQIMQQESNNVAQMLRIKSRVTYDFWCMRISKHQPAQIGSILESICVFLSSHWHMSLKLILISQNIRSYAENIRACTWIVLSLENKVLQDVIYLFVFPKQVSFDS